MTRRPFAARLDAAAVPLAAFLSLHDLGGSCGGGNGGGGDATKDDDEKKN